MTAPAHRPFRFSTFATGYRSRAELVEFAHRLESIGVSAMLFGYHHAFGLGGTLVEMATVAGATTRLRLGNHVINNDLQHPALLAGELAALDLLSEGRVEIGIGAGWLKMDYDALGLPFDRGAVRLARLEEAIALIKQLYREEAASFSGAHYQVSGLSIQPKPHQRPHPPIFVGGGKQRLLSFAAREADIIGLDPGGTPEGGVDMLTATAEAFDQKVAWVRAAAGERLSQIELHVLVHQAFVTDDRRRGAERAMAWYATWPDSVASRRFPDVETTLQTPMVLVGSVSQICETLRERRERYGISYITLPPETIGDLAPVIERLAGT